MSEALGQVATFAVFLAVCIVCGWLTLKLQGDEDDFRQWEREMRNEEQEESK